MNIFRNNWRTNKEIIIKLGVQMYIDTMSLSKTMGYIIAEVIRSINKSKF